MKESAKTLAQVELTDPHCSVDHLSGSEGLSMVLTTDILMTVVVTASASCECHRGCWRDRVSAEGCAFFTFLAATAPSSQSTQSLSRANDQSSPTGFLPPDPCMLSQLRLPLHCSVHTTALTPHHLQHGATLSLWRLIRHKGAPVPPCRGACSSLQMRMRLSVRLTTSRQHSCPGRKACNHQQCTTATGASRRSVRTFRGSDITAQMRSLCR